MLEKISLFFLFLHLIDGQLSQPQANGGQQPYIFDLPPLQLQPLQLRLNPSSSSLLLVRQNETIPIDTYQSPQNSIHQRFQSTQQLLQSLSQPQQFSPQSIPLFTPHSAQQVIPQALPQPAPQPTPQPIPQPIPTVQIGPEPTAQPALQTAQEAPESNQIFSGFSLPKPFRSSFPAMPRPQQSFPSQSLIYQSLSTQSSPFMPLAFQPQTPTTQQTVSRLPGLQQLSASTPQTIPTQHLTLQPFSAFPTTSNRQNTQSLNRNTVPKQSSVEYENLSFDSILNDLSMYVPLQTPGQGLQFQQMVPIQTLTAQAPQKNTRILPPITLPPINIPNQEQGVRTFAIELPPLTNGASNANSGSQEQNTASVQSLQSTSQTTSTQPNLIEVQALPAPEQPLTTQSQPVPTQAQSLSTQAQPDSTQAQPLPTQALPNPAQLFPPLSQPFKFQPFPTQAPSPFTLPPLQPLPAPVQPAPAQPTPATETLTKPGQPSFQSFRSLGSSQPLGSFRTQSYQTISSEKQTSVPRVQSILFPLQKEFSAQSKPNSNSRQTLVQTFAESKPQTQSGLTSLPANPTSSSSQELTRTSIKRSTGPPSKETQTYNREFLQVLRNEKFQRRFGLALPLLEEPKNQQNQKIKSNSKGLAFFKYTNSNGINQENRFDPIATLPRPQPLSTVRPQPQLTKVEPRLLGIRTPRAPKYTPSFKSYFNRH